MSPKANGGPDVAELSDMTGPLKEAAGAMSDLGACAPAHPHLAALTWGADDLALARRIVAAFDENHALGTIGIDGKMYDIPHLKQARRVLASVGESQG
jgi:citrate lyase beta subunit